VSWNGYPIMHTLSILLGRDGARTTSSVVLILS
jgi:hypothetical protein